MSRGWAEWVGTAATGTTYVASGAVCVNEVMKYMDQHAAAFGVMIGAITCITNFVSKWLHRRDYQKVLAKIDPEMRRSDDDY